MFLQAAVNCSLPVKVGGFVTYQCADRPTSVLQQHSGKCRLNMNFSESSMAALAAAQRTVDIEEKQAEGNKHSAGRYDFKAKEARSPN